MWGAFRKHIPWKGARGLGHAQVWVLEDCILTLTMGFTLKSIML